MNPRNDPAILERLCLERECRGPSWWACETRGCYVDALEHYAEAIREGESARGYPQTTVCDDGNGFQRTAHGRKWRG